MSQIHSSCSSWSGGVENGLDFSVWAEQKERGTVFQSHLVSVVWPRASHPSCHQHWGSDHSCCGGLSVRCRVFSSLLGLLQGFPGGSAGKESACKAGDPSSAPGLGRALGEGDSSPLQYSGLENSTDCTVHGVARSWSRLSDFPFHILV